MYRSLITRISTSNLIRPATTLTRVKHNETLAAQLTLLVLAVRQSHTN
jgi:hypothetical protein